MYECTSANNSSDVVSETRNPRPETRDPRPETRNPKPQSAAAVKSHEGTTWPTTTVMSSSLPPVCCAEMLGVGYDLLIIICQERL
jgi:hypothetical protein